MFTFWPLVFHLSESENRYWAENNLIPRHKVCFWWVFMVWAWCRVGIDERRREWPLPPGSAFRFQAGIDDPTQDLQTPALSWLELRNVAWPWGWGQWHPPDGGAQCCWHCGASSPCAQGQLPASQSQQKDKQDPAALSEERSQHECMERHQQV
jgi:hypothetical protein